MSLVHSTLKFIQKHHLFNKEDHLLIAVSGGIDSLSLLDVLHRLKYNLSVAHVNYRLRGSESDLDQSLVEAECKKKSIPCYIYKCSDQMRDDMKAGNLQAKARDIRYQFFSDIIFDKGIQIVCTGHTSDDQIETFIYNTIRGSGLTGLTSLKFRREFTARPLLYATKSQIRKYAADNKIVYRTDQSNLENDYDRNFIRNQVIPQLEERFPDLRKSIKTTMRNLHDENDLLTHFSDQLKTVYIIDSDHTVIIQNIERLRCIPGFKSLIYRWVSAYNFKTDQISDMMSARVGAIFYNDKYKAVVDRDSIIIKANLSTETAAKEISVYGQTSLNNHTQLQIQRVGEFKINTEPTIEIVDHSKLLFPLSIRPWTSGDRIKPLGMNGKSKKISDLFVDLKLNAFQKEEVLLLCNHDGEIIWVIGYKLSNSVKVDSNTVDFARLEVEQVIN